MGKFLSTKFFVVCDDLVLFLHRFRRAALKQVCHYRVAGQLA